MRDILEILNEESREAAIAEMGSEEVFQSFLASEEALAKDWFEHPEKIPPPLEDAKQHVFISESVLSQVKTQSQIDEEIERVLEKKRKENEKKIERLKKKDMKAFKEKKPKEKRKKSV